MMYEPYKRKRKRRARKKHRLLGALLRLLILCALLIGIAGGLLYVLPAGLFAIEPDADLSPNSALPASPINILLLGVDAESDGQQRSDSMIVASIGADGVRLISILRDTAVDIPGYGEGRVNSAYAHGGAELAVRTVNANFGLNIMHWCVADYATLVRLVDAVGGIDVDVTAEELEQINHNVYSVRRSFKRLGYSYTPLTISGPGTHLNGLQALGYARIRKLDSDFVRASRQRTVLAALLKKVRARFYDPVLLYRLAAAALKGLKTDLSAPMLASLGLKAAAAGEVKTLRVPVNDSYQDTGAQIRITDPELNRRAIYEFLYPSP